MNPFLLIAAILALGMVYVLLPVFANEQRKFRGKRLVTCPETARTAAVELDATHAALRAIAGGHDLKIRECSRWPARQNCAQECVREIGTAASASQAR